MTLHSLYLQRPAKVVTFLAILAFVWLWLGTVHSSGGSGGFLPTNSHHPVDDTETTVDVPSKPQDSPKSEYSIPSTDSEKTNIDPETVPAPPSIDFTTDGTKHKAPLSKIAKISVTTNKLNAPVIDRAFLTHTRHNERHGYMHYIAKYQAVSELIEHDRQHRAAGAWTKPAYILSILVAELEKPPEERLKWVFWFDADTAIMNPYTPLEIFTPPDDAEHEALKNVDLLIASNWDGLNSGVFALRVAPWSVSFISAVLAYPIYETERQKTDRFRDQSAFQFLLANKESPLADTPMKGHDHWVEVPIRWFNSLPVNNAFYGNGTWVFGKNMTECLFDKGTEEVCDDGHEPLKVNAWKIMQGDLCVHFAGSSWVRDSWMEPWIDRAEAELPEWANATTKDRLAEETKKFWAETNDKMKVEIAKSKIEEEEKKKAREKAEKEKKEKEEQGKKDKAEKERKAKEEKDMAARQKKLDKEKAREEKEKAKLDKQAGLSGVSGCLFMQNR
ncbi:hypothetical protein V8F20_012724 [Naviculisporaceae sp. PSN 640]